MADKEPKFTHRVNLRGLTPAQKDQLRRESIDKVRANPGKSVSVLASEIGVSKSTLDQWLNEAGAQRPRGQSRRPTGSTS